MRRDAIGPYRIVGVLGQGGMGVVYRGVHADTGEAAAVKTVRLASATMLASFRREVLALSALRHPGVVRVVDDGVDDGTPWYAMDLLQGVTLRRFAEAAMQDLYPNTVVDEFTRTLRQEPVRLTAPTVEFPAAGSGAVDVGASPPNRSRVRLLVPILTVVRRLCAALAYVHGEGIVHRDLKPDNVFVVKGGRPVLVDFGLAASFAARGGREEIDVARGLAGTPAYMAPEQVRGDLVDARADLYALGCVLYEILTGRPPFHGGRPNDITRAHLYSEPVPPSMLVEGVPEDLDRCVLQLLAKQPSDRIGHASDLAAILASLGAEIDPDDDLPPARPYLYRPGFSGRGTVLRALSQRLASAEAGVGGVLLVSGESGAGKTRLAMELASIAHRLGMLTLVGGCDPVGAGGAVPLNGFRRPLQAIADRCRERGMDETRRLLGERGALLGLYEPCLAGLPGLVPSTDLGARSADAFRARLYATLAETLAALAAEQPVLLILDDLQWADELTLGFLEDVARRDRFAALPILVCGTFRSDDGAEPLRKLVEAVAGETVELGRLTDGEIVAIAGEMLAATPPPERVARFLCERASGNPFFAAEYLRAAVDDGLLARDPAGRWMAIAGAGDLEGLPLPGSLRELFARRLGGLSASASEVLAAAAVAGREASIALLEDMLSPGGDALLAALTELLRRSVLEERPTGRVAFSHDKLRELAYDSLDGAVRARLHLAAARAIEASGATWRGVSLAELGYHWERAGDDATAARYYLASAKTATARYALAEAARLYESYFRLARPRTVESADAHGHYARKVLRPLGRTTEAARELETALAEARATGSRSTEALALRWQGSLLYETGRLEEAAERFKAALTIARDLGDRDGEARALTNLAVLDHERGLLDAAATTYERALAVRPDLVAAGTNLALLRHQQGRVDEARVLYSRALERAAASGDRSYEATAVMNLAILEKESGRYAASAALYARALDLAQSVGDRRFEGMALGNRADLHWDAGEIDQAHALYGRALAIHREVGNRRFEGITLCNLGTAAAAFGDVVTAREAYREALAIHREIGDSRFEGITLMESAGLARRVGAYAEAERLLEEAEAAIGVGGEKMLVALARCARGHLALALAREARTWLDEALSLASELGARRESHLGRAVAALARALDAFEKERALVHGECPEDLPVALGGSRRDVR